MSYLLFAGHRYCSLGGIKDLRHKSDSLEDCMLFFAENAKEIANGSYIDNWAQIVEAKTLEIVATGWVENVDGNLSMPGTPEWRNGDFDRWEGD